VNVNTQIQESSEVLALLDRDKCQTFATIVDLRYSSPSASFDFRPVCLLIYFSFTKAQYHFDKMAVKQCSTLSKGEYVQPFP
jgi:hypothetical protein